ncbi:MAG TPA: UDP-3-O-(3-hydroxymyristoyl)glucosamine N-acyltransferase [Tepidisphaeraceae bacterium]|jgi:UDP-3-O-[3-hydroxymyristoyl] glucosamine N-acyltransferase
MPTLADIAAALNVPVRGTDTQGKQISAVASLTEAGPSDISFLSSDAYLKQFKSTRAAAVIVQKRVKLPANPRPAVLLVDDADLAIARVLQLFAPPVPRPADGIDKDARIAPDAVIADSAALGPFVVVGRRSRIGARSILHSGVVIGDDVVIGADCQIFPNVVVRERITIGDRVIIHAGSILGTDGFGYRWDGTKHAKIPQIGTIEIEDDVEIGSCVCVDRAKSGVTRVGKGTKVDNLVQIAHNCVIGPHCIIVGQAGLAGSATLGAGVVIGGQGAVRDHVTMGDGSIAAARAGVTENVEPGMTVSGIPALPHRQSLREQAAMRRLPHLLAQMRRLQDEIEQLKRQTQPPSKR